MDLMDFLVLTLTLILILATLYKWDNEDKNGD